MSAAHPSTPRGAPTRAAKDLRLAWLWVLLIPVASVVATVLGEWAIGALGYPSGGDKAAARGIAAMVGLPATLIGVAPAVLAAVHGRRARREGLPPLVPALIGTVVALYWAVVTIAGLFLA
ncbi:MAG: hypothetical protein ACXV2I_00725 [Actinomycetes bacterium]